MNSLLFRVAELEEKITNLMKSENQLERMIAENYLKILEAFKYYPIRSHEESYQILEKLNHTFKIVE